jgi:hypothetical protein
MAQRYSGRTEYYPSEGRIQEIPIPSGRTTPRQQTDKLAVAVKDEDQIFALESEPCARAEQASKAEFS